MVLGILGLAAMILCWAAGSYWKKVYYLVWLLSLPMPIFWFLYSFSMDEDGDGGSSGRIEAVLMVIILIILVIIYVKARNLGDAINTFLLMNVYILLMILLSDSDFNRWNRIVRLIVFVATLLTLDNRSSCHISCKRVFFSTAKFTACSNMGQIHAGCIRLRL